MNSRTLGIVLIVFGLLIYLANISMLSGEAVLIGIGLGLLIVYFTSRRSIGFLISGAVVTAVGAFAAVDRWLPGEHGYLFFLFLALAFAAVYLVELNHERGGWAGWVAVALAAFSAFVFFVEVDTPLAATLRSWWPALLVIAGLWLLFGGRRTPRGRE